MTRPFHALTALALVSAAGAAGATDRVRLGVGGYFEAGFAAVNQDEAAATGLRDHGFFKELEIHFKGSTVMDNGITVGADVQLEAYVNADQIDEQYIWFEGSFGRIVLGSENSASYLLHVAAVSASPLGGVNEPSYRFFSAPGGNAAGGFYTTRPSLTSDDDKITWLSPRWAGFQVGASYAPDDNDDSATVALAADTEAGVHAEVVELGANWAGTLGPVDVKLSIGGGRGRLEAQDAGATFDDDRLVWGVGGRLGWSGWIVSAAYSEDDLGTSGAAANDFRSNLETALLYSAGAWSGSVAYIRQELAFNSDAGNDRQSIWDIAAAYALSPGVELSAGIQIADLAASDRLPGRTLATQIGLQNDATVFYSGVVLAF